MSAVQMKISDPLEILFVREVMRTHVAVLSPTLSRNDLPALHNSRRGQLLYPAVGPDGTLLGVVTRKDLQKLASNERPDEQRHVFIAHEIEGRSFKELAAETGLKVKTLIARKHHAVLRLRRRLQAIYDEFLNA